MHRTEPHDCPGTQAHVRSQVAYLRPQPAQPYHYMYAPPEGIAVANCRFDPADVLVRDARSCGVQPRLHTCGFQLLEHSTAVRDFRDDEQVRRLMYPELRELVLAATGGSDAFVFDHQYRRREAGRPQLGFGRLGEVTGPVGYVHNDYTQASGVRRFEAVLRRRPAGRFSIVNVWRSAAGPVLDTPLAFCDSRSIPQADLVTTEIRYPGRTGEIYVATRSDSHEWSYFPRLQPTEAIVFKQFDSSTDVSRFTPHAALPLPVPEGTPLRESIETRVIVIYEEG